MSNCAGDCGGSTCGGSLGGIPTDEVLDRASLNIGLIANSRGDGGGLSSSLIACGGDS